MTGKHGVPYKKFVVNEIKISLLINSLINGSTAFVGPWPLLQFRNLFHTDGRTPRTSDQPVARKKLILLSHIKLEVIYV
jgi:hypothetical protein